MKAFQLIKPYEHECFVNGIKELSIHFNKVLWVRAPFTNQWKPSQAKREDFVLLPFLHKAAQWKIVDIKCKHTQMEWKWNE